MTYGDVAEFVGTRAARNVGRVLAADGGTVPWHRVLRSDGSCAEHLRPSSWPDSRPKACRSAASGSTWLRPAGTVAEPCGATVGPV